MTTAIRERVEIKAPATVLRRVECDERDAAILCAVLRGVSNYRALSDATGVSKSNLFYRVEGYHGESRRKGGGLIRRGYVLGGLDGEFNVIRPGPRLAGIDHGWPLELVEVEV